MRNVYIILNSDLPLPLFLYEFEVGNNSNIGIKLNVGEKVMEGLWS